MKAVFDSDVLVDYLVGLEKAKQEFDLYSEKCISIISWMEVADASSGVKIGDG